MPNFFQGKRKTYLKWLEIVVLACLVCFFLVWYLSRPPEVEKSPLPQMPQPQKGLTSQKIQEILNKKTPENQRKPLAPEEIQKIFNKKTPENQKKPLSPEKIQEILNKKAR